MIELPLYYLPEFINLFHFMISAASMTSAS
jgi:hypothetical protein